MKKPRHGVSGRAPGVEIGTDVSLRIDWKNLVSNLTAVATQGFATAHGITDETSNAISALISAASSIKIESTPGQRAWELVSLAIAWSLDELRHAGAVGALRAGTWVKSAIESAKEGATAETAIMTATFLTTPCLLPLYTQVRDSLVKYKADFRLNSNETDLTLQSRFDIAFNRAVFEIWSKNSDLLQPLQAALLAPGAAASAHDLEWNAYRESLIYDFEVKAVFGQEETKVSVSQLYIPLRAIWIEEDNEPEGKRQDLPSRPRKKLHLVELDRELDDWVLHAPIEDCFRLIGGGPGSGKSTTARALASRLARRADTRPLFVPLQHINLSGDLREEVSRFFVSRTRGIFRQPPLARDAVEAGPPLVLIFDGLDELARPGEAANEVARLFVSKAHQLISSLSVYPRRG